MRRMRMNDTPRDVDAEAPGMADDGHPGAGSFWRCGSGVRALDDPTPFGQENALQRLGKPPFEKTARGRFRLLGYLATVYEHVSQDIGLEINGVQERADAAGGSEEAEPFAQHSEPAESAPQPGPEAELGD
jgi:hypothetical protein